MTFLPSLALKNLFRYSRRTLITSSAIAFGIMIFILMDSLLVGIAKESERNLIWYETGSAAFFHPEYWEDHELKPVDRSIENPEALVQQMASRGIPAVPRVEFAADMIVYQDPFPEYGNIQVQVTGIDPRHDNDVFQLKKTVIRGRYLEEDEEGIMMGQWLANDLGADVGYPVTLVTRTMDGYYQTMDMDVVAILLCDNPMVNRYGLYAPLDTVQYALDMNGYASAVYTSLPMGKGEGEGIEQMMEVAEPLGLEVLDWRVMGADFVALAEAKAEGSSTILFLVFLIAAVGISNTILMSIMERVRELGMMRAMGMKDHQIRRMFLMEAAGIGFFGSLGGVILGALANIFMVNKGIDYSRMMQQGDMGYRFAGIAYGIWNPGTFVTAFVVGLIMAVMVAWFPTRRALRMEITSCLRYV
ncbi:MAG: ABC transporter permease [Spirochaetaceae bacterium 4572_59]|nr:MAG: ABC transporter permease [Spirochaetaceae bacterium 4572_59]